MRRYVNRNRDMMGFEPPIQQPPYMPSKLDPKDERLIEQSEEIGWQKGQNELLAEDNSRLEDENRSLKQRNQELHERNLELERKEAGEISEERTTNKIIADVKAALKDKE